MHVVLFCMCGFVSVRFICSALPLSFMGCVGLLCFALFFYYICCFCFGVLCLYSCWFALFSFIVRCLVPCCLVSFCFVWLFALGLIEFASSCVVLCGIAPFRFVLFRFVLLPVHLHLAVCLGRNMFFSSQPMCSARSSRENATLRGELQDNSHFKDGAPGKSVSSA